MDSSSRTALGLLLLAVDRDDVIGAINALIQLLDRPDELSERDLERDVGQLMVRYRGGLGSRGSAGMFGGLMKMISHHRFAVPLQVGAALRALGALEWTVRMISPQVDLVSAARTEGRAYMSELADTSSVRERLEGEMIKVLPLLQRMPLRLNRLTDDLENGRLTVNVRSFADRRDRQYLTNLVNQVTVAIIATAVTLGGIILLTSDGGPPIASVCISIRCLAMRCCSSGSSSAYGSWCWPSAARGPTRCRERIVNRPGRAGVTRAA